MSRREDGRARRAAATRAPQDASAGQASAAHDAPGRSAAADAAEVPSHPRTSGGFGRVLVLVYGLFAVAATGRAVVQIAERWSEAPVPYALSAFAAAVYGVATVALGRGGPVARRVAWLACGVELLGVLTVGTVSLLRPEWFPSATVWSGLGQGYGYVPLILPFVGLWWLRRTRPAGQPRAMRSER